MNHDAKNMVEMLRALKGDPLDNAHFLTSYIYNTWALRYPSEIPADYMKSNNIPIDQQNKLYEQFGIITFLFDRTFARNHEGELCVNDKLVSFKKIDNRLVPYIVINTVSREYGMLYLMHPIIDNSMTLLYLLNRCIFAGELLAIIVGWDVVLNSL
jgi:hypothetical protein